MSFLSPDREADISAGTAIREPKRYKVLLHNDNYTRMDFVVDVLISIFRKSPQEATNIMRTVHEKGCCICGIYTQEVAETKLEQVRQRARQSGFPLRCTMEET
ncbi:MAG: ATP-dependent Clp protease adaptor ClpS [Desulfovibrio sp.]|jgi:ATP-dependent Clp protease adaptor protein ClpS|nr:ATP-dependent Clp protease adaptor ClpS [Desulfovibrio sp.]